LVPAQTILHGTVPVVIATTNPWPALLIGIAVVVAVCLWLLFRRGSIAHRARTDEELLDGLGARTDHQSSNQETD
jgi:hypothetical protein